MAELPADGPQSANASALAASNWLAQGLAHVVDFAIRWPRCVLGLGLFLAAVSMLAAGFRLEYHTQRSDLIDPDKESQRRWRQYLAEFGDDDDMVAVVRGHDPARMKQGIDALAERVRQKPEHFDRLFYRVDLRTLHDRALLYLPTQRIQQIQADLRKMDPLLRFGPLAWSQLTLHELLKKARDQASKMTLGEPLDPSVDQFLTQLTAIVKTATTVVTRPEDYRNPWSSLVSQPPQGDLMAEPQYFFSNDQSLAFLLVRPTKTDADPMAPARADVEAMRQVVAATRAEFPDLEFGLTGLPVLETDEMVASQNDSNLAAWLALAAVTLLYLVVYRGLRYPLLTVLTLVIGTCWAMGWLTLTVGHLNILSATFAVMLIGLGDYGVLWVTRFDQERRDGRSLCEAMRQTALQTGPGILTAAAGTALAFYATMLADFRAVAELGWIAGTGVLLCAVACFTMLPAMLALTQRRAPIMRSAPAILSLPRERRSDVWLPSLMHRPRQVLAAAGIVAVGLGMWATHVGYDHNLLHMQARGLESVQWELALIEKTAGASWHALSFTASPAEALALKQRYEQLPSVSRVVEVASLIPPDQQYKHELLQDIHARLNWLPERGRPIPHIEPNLRAIRGEVVSLIGALEPHALASSDIMLSQLVRSLGELRDQLSLGNARQITERLRVFEQRLTADLAEDLHRLREVSRPQPIELADLPADLRERYVGVTGKWLLRAFGKDCLWEYEPLAHFVHEVKTVDPDATGKPFRTLEGLRAMKHGFAWAGVYSLLAILLVLWLDFRDLRHVGLALAPLVAGVAAALGIMALCGVPLNPANMLALPLIVGVGVDNGVHVLHDYRSRVRGRAYALGAATGRGILVAGLTTILGFGALMVSRHQGLISLGFVLALGVASCMAAALVVLPAALRVLSPRYSREARQHSATQTGLSPCESYRQAA